MLAWLALGVVAVLGQAVAVLPGWLAVHLLLLGAATNAIVIWSEHFVVTLCRVPEPPARRIALGLAVLNTAITLVLVGGWTGVVWLLGAGAAGVTVIITVHSVQLVRWSRSPLAGRFRYLARFYAVAGAALVLAGLLGGLMGLGAGGPWYPRFWLAHVHLTLLGWVGLAVVGTLFTLWPTVLGTRLPEGSVTSAQRSLWLLGTGLGLSAASLLLGSRWLATVGVLGFAAGLGVAAGPLLVVARRRMPRVAAGWMLAAGMAWLAVATLADLGVLVTAPSLDEVVARINGALPALVVGFVAQVLLGALTYLLPVILSRGPRERRDLDRRINRGWVVRLVALNLAVPLIGLDVRGYVTAAGWLLAAASIGAFAALAVPVVVSVVARGGLPPEPGIDRAGRWAPVVGLLAGVAAVMAAVLVGTAGTMPGSAPPVAASGVARTVDVELAGMRITPGEVEVEPGTRVVLRVSNRDSMAHDLRADGGAHTPLLRRGQSADLDLGVLGGDTTAWCTVTGHRAAGMIMHVHVTGQQHHDQAAQPDDGAALDLRRRPSAGWTPRDAHLAASPDERVHRIELHAIERDVEVAPGTRQRMWTFGGTVPGPTLRGQVGDEFEITLINDGTLGHGIDFHASALAPDGPMRTIQPGQRLAYRFTARQAGIWLYHCSTMPMLQHLASGMYGAVIIDPPDIARVDAEYALVASQLYLGQPGSDTQVAKLRANRPDGWMWGGMAAQYDHAPLTVKTGQRVRFWVLNAGPGDTVAFHVVGTQFDTAYKEGATLLRPGTGGAAQTLDLAPAQGGYVETVFPEPGTYALVDHDLRHAEAGAHGLIRVTP